MGGSTYVDGSSTSDVIAYQGQNSMSGKSQAPLQEIPYDEQGDVADYISSHLESAGGGRSVLMEDGTWKAFSSYGELSTAANYARTSDGYLRIKEVTLQPSIGGQYYNRFVSYRLYDFPPQKPEASMNSYSPSPMLANASRRPNTIAIPTAEDVFVDVEIGFKNTEGCKDVLVEQTDADYPVPYTYFVDPNDGSFIAYMNKRYPSTFRLTYYNDNGEVMGDPLTIDLTGESASAANGALRVWIIGNSLRYKNWSLNAFFNAAFGVQRLNALRFSMNSMIGNSRMFTDADFLSQVGVTMPDPRVENNQYIGNSSKWVENADYFRCENITLAYDFPKSMTKFADLRLSFSVQNLFTLTGYKGSNPSSYSFSSDYGDRAAGIDTGTYPTPRTFTFGLRMNF